MKKDLSQIILRPIITEKSKALMENGIYVFEVLKSATKKEIKESVEKIFKVKVEKVRTINVRGKRRQKGIILGKSSSFKKAYVKLKKGEKIEF